MTLYGHVLAQDPLHRRFKKFTNLAHLPSLTLIYINFVMDLWFLRCNKTTDDENAQLRDSDDFKKIKRCSLAS